MRTDRKHKLLVEAMPLELSCSSPVSYVQHPVLSGARIATPPLPICFHDIGLNFITKYRDNFTCYLVIFYVLGACETMFGIHIKHKLLIKTAKNELDESAESILHFSTQFVLHRVHASHQITITSVHISSTRDEHCQLLNIPKFSKMIFLG